MNKVVKIEETNRVYNISLKSLTAILFASFFAFALGLGLNFSLDDKVTTLISNSVRQNRQCPMNFKDLTISYLIPKIEFTNFSITERCLGPGNKLTFDSITSGLSLPSFSPFGPTLHTIIKDSASEIDILSVHGIFNHHIKISSSKLSSKTFSPLLGNFKIAGLYNFNTDIGTNFSAINNMTLQLKSMNFSIPAQTIEGFEVPNLIIGPLSLKLEMLEENNLKVLEFILGNELSPIRATIKGNLNLVPANIKRSKVDLIATVKFSASFLESFSILNLFLDASKQDGEGFYKIKLTGTLNKLDKPEFLN